MTDSFSSLLLEWQQSLRGFKFSAVLIVLTMSSGAMPAAILPSDRQIVWAAGVPGGIPTFPVAINVKNPPYNAAGNGATDDTAAIQNAIDACPVGQAVYLPPGTYSISNTLNISHRIALRGAGIGQTVLRYSGTAGIVMIQMHNGGNIGNAVPVTSGSSKGSASVTVSDSSPFSVGTYVCLRQLNPSFVSVSGDNGTITWASRNDNTRAMSQLNKIAAISGNALRLERPCYVDMPNSPELKPVQLMEGGGVEEMTLNRTNQASGSDGQNVNFNSVANGWIKDVESINTGRAHFRLTICFRCEIRGCTANSANSAFEHDGDHAYGCFNFDWNSDNLVENNIATGCRHSIIFEGGGERCRDRL